MELNIPLLHRACAGQTLERTHPDVTIQTGWDGDRLDLGRVGIAPYPGRLCTEVARRPETIHGPDGRAKGRVVPTFIREGWGIDLGAAEARVIRDLKGGTGWTPG